MPVFVDAVGCCAAHRLSLEAKADDPLRAIAYKSIRRYWKWMSNNSTKNKSFFNDYPTISCYLLFFRKSLILI
jgi:hypothetical protein